MKTTPIDMAVYNALKEAAGAEFVVELVGTFLEEAPPMLAELHGARADPADEHASERFRRAAHSLKSNAQTFGAMALGDLARSLEQGGLPADAAALDALDAAYAAAAAALKELAHGR